MTVDDVIDRVLSSLPLAAVCLLGYLSWDLMSLLERAGLLLAVPCYGGLILFILNSGVSPEPVAQASGGLARPLKTAS